jgi:SagB-type dehydrogenase family enzyme
MVAFSCVVCASQEVTKMVMPKPRLTGAMSLEEAIAKRRSVRDFVKEDLTPEQISQLCWSAQGITDKGRGYRAAPSAGALYPLEIYMVTGQGLYHYLPERHELEQRHDRDLRSPLSDAALGQSSVARAGATMVITAVVKRTAGKYGRRAERYCLLEVGHAAQNVLLQAVTLGLGAVPIGAYEDAKVHRLLKLPRDADVLYMIPIGKPAA